MNFTALLQFFKGLNNGFRVQYKTVKIMLLNYPCNYNTTYYDVELILLNENSFYFYFCIVFEIKYTQYLTTCNV